MARTLTGNNPKREQRIQSIMLDRLQLRYQRRIAAEIARAMRAAAKAYPKDPSTVMNAHRERMDKILNRLWSDSGRTMAEHVDTTGKAHFSRERKEIQVSPTELAARIMQDWIATTGGLKITEITDTTLASIRTIIDKGIADGATEQEIARAIRDLAPGIGGSRAQTIARTETHEAANVSGLATAQATGLRMLREWAASNGDRTRRTHRDADGQKVSMDGRFKVGRALLRFPGDSSGGYPEETINCRCAVVYVLSA